ncbi:MAG: aspartate carbamoyltransferase regulatory subunit [Aeromonas sp.]
MSTKPQLQVEAIEQGTVIDHIPAGLGLRLLKLFALLATHERITVGFNLKSGALGHKDIIKIEHVTLSTAQANQLALFAPQATVNLIEDFRVVHKLTPQLPSHVTDLFSCPNSNCISHVEPVVSHFAVKRVQDAVRMQCHYCEKSFPQNLMMVS